ncbi:RING finger protein nhl-1 isoform X1 [Phlebotomus papatasi]|uniref:RING finger protein nhl-1 isoform X1 n=1 Tax=Phlebotomus papatasi TaxID=29031 RepID=UPI0024836FEC|nr:RING finger protein nhl-1 isoform X1 [Phlebotomus papatasi]XP_055700898.1 RING finger protein nhl-1 isoform X1 [Phlebotomus papatasi]XP_055700900.1 RING finger protein nhl-1 isoform X1 [Phlebotomus papatasi]
MEQFEQLLTCCVCLDRYRNPKLLPCQHSFCMEPCMEGLVDYVRRQVKCPECRAEHRIPYQGVQAFPTNVTLQRFLELHIEITGELPDPTSGQVMERCNVCSEKAYCSACAHCEKKICEDCKSAHMDILRREILRINSQIRRGINRLQDALAIVEKNTLSLQSNCVSVSEEVDEIYRRLSKALKDRSDHLRTEIDRYLGTELRNLTNLRENLDLEIGNIQSNCDLADKYITESVEWDDSELMDTKEIFLKTVEFLRNFEYENADYSRRVRFVMAIDPNQLVINVSTFGDLNIFQPATSSPSGMLQPPNVGPGLMRSKSDHRLATQFRQQEEQRGHGYDDEPPLSGRKFGERHAGRNADRYGDRYGRDYGGDYEYDEPSSRPAKSRFRSRFVRSHQGDNDSDNEPTRSVRFHEKEKEKERDRVIDTEDVARGQLSGIIRLTDSPRVMKRIQEQSREKKEKKESTVVAPVLAAQQKAAAVKKTPTPAARQVSEDDEISRIKRQNKGAPSGAAAAPEPERPASERVSALKRTTGGAGTASDDSDSSRNSSARKTPPQVESTNSGTPKAPTPAPKKTTRSASSDSSTSTDSSSSAAPRNTGAAFTTEEVKQKYLQRSSIDATADATPPRTRPTEASASPTAAAAASTEKKPFQSRFLPNHQSPKPKEESESSTEEETSTEESEEESEEETEEVKSTTTTSTSTPVVRTPPRDTAMKTDIGPLLARSSQARDTAESRRTSREEPKTSYSSTNNSYRNYERESSPKYGAAGGSGVRSRASALHTEPEDHGRYGSGASSGSSYTSRFLNKSKSTAVVPPDEDRDLSTAEDSDSRYGSSGRSRYLALKERRNRLARSRSSHNFGNDDDDLDEPLSPTTASPSAYLASRYGASSSLASQPTDLSRSRSSHALKSRENSPDRSTGTDKDGAALSSWARYLKNKYGNRSTAKETRDPGPSSTSSVSSSSASRRLSLGLPLRQANELASSDDDSKNGLGSPTSPTVAAVGITGAAGMSPRTQYLQKRRQLFQLGGRGSEPGSFTWPRGIAVSPDNNIVVADSSNHRVQIFDANGIFMKEFGEYGNAEGEFDCLAGVAVNRIGQYIIADRYNHRIQVLDPAGRFLRAFGSQGTADGKFNYPWGVTTDALGFIYVCDKENHRVQVFQSDGTFVGKFGTCGSKEGQLEHPHYIAVSNTNRVIVSDSNNHRIQIFDVNGRVLSTFGSEGCEDGQFKFPRGVAVDDQGYICVADSGNNRIQIFTPDGSFLRAFGSWGSADSEFKGLEGVAIMSNGNILVCDRENHRVQVF